MSTQGRSERPSFLNRFSWHSWPVSWFNTNLAAGPNWWFAWEFHLWEALNIEHVGTCLLQILHAVSSLVFSEDLSHRRPISIYISFAFTLPFDFWLSSRIYWHFFLTKLSIGFPPLHLELLICAICFLSIKTCLVWVTRSLLLWLHAMHRKSTSHLTHDNQKGCPTRRIVYEWALAMSHGRSGILSLGFVEPPER